MHYTIHIGFPQLLGSCLYVASPTRDKIVAAFNCSLSAVHTLPLGRKTCNIIIYIYIYIYWASDEWSDHKRHIFMIQVGDTDSTQIVET